MREKNQRKKHDQHNQIIKNNKKEAVVVPTPTTKGKKGKKKKGNETLEELKKKNYNNIKPINNPQQLPQDGPYVEPCGVDPTDGIVESIVGEMLRKVGKLLLKSISFDDKKREMGEISFPIKLQTACSGTDAPSIALGLIKESLDRLKVEDESSSSEDDDDDGHETTRNGRLVHGFEYEHQMSCEIETFKQAYIGRNFKGVLLFPDITKLTESEEVTDVYGRPQKIPEGGNLFVAGTSCKDFSMLKSSRRKDIEDQGTSGFTFLAAVEFLEQEQPPFAIFENVDGAPWDKMQEYIQGKISLCDRNSMKKDSINKDKDNDSKESNNKVDKANNADHNLKFSINDEGKYITEVVPRQVGVQAGLPIEGFMKGESTKLRSLVASKKTREIALKNKKKEKDEVPMITLGQLAKEHNIDLEHDTLVMEKNARYHTHLVKLDTKNYGLPQTRNRKYLFVWRSDDPNDDLGTYLEEIMDYLKTPLLHSMDAFLLPETHDRIRCFREALRSGPGLMVARERNKELDFWDFELSKVKDVALHMVYREKCGIEERSRWLTNWDTRGRRKVAPGLWPELVQMWNMRRCDLIDCFAAAAIRDNISRDPLHHNFSWDLSQNVNRATVRSATVGVSGCVTPGGELLLPNKGRNMMGYEKLLLQGIPFSRLLLGPETEVQLSDLAGNAMSVPVVCATIIAAICAPQLRREQQQEQQQSKKKKKKVITLGKKKNKKSDSFLSDYELQQKYDSANGAVLAERGDLFQQDTSSVKSQDFVETFSLIAKELAEDAYLCSVLCNSESSGQTISKDEKIFECTQCGMGICQSYADRCQIVSHKLTEISPDLVDKRLDPHTFEMKLRCAVPSALQMGKGKGEKGSWESEIKECRGLESYSFQLQAVDRKRGHWLLTYGAWEDHGSGRQVAEIRVQLGQIGARLSKVGFAAYVKCFAPAIRHNNPHRGTLHDSARLRLFKQDDDDKDSSVVCWETRGKTWEEKLNIVGSDPQPSQRAQIGITDVAQIALKKHKPMKKFIPDIESRNDLLRYHSKWKTWPGKIEICGDRKDIVNGTYIKMSCQHTVVLSALWKREETLESKPLYIYIRPDVIRSGLDVAVIAETPCYRDKMEVCELKDWIPENALTEKTHETKARFWNWKRSPELALEVPAPVMVMEDRSSHEKSFHEEIIRNTTNSTNSLSTLCEIRGLSNEVMESLLQYSVDDTTNATSSSSSRTATIDLVGKLGTRNSKRLSIVAAPTLLKYAAENKLPLQLSCWYALQQPKDCNFGLCERNFPTRPVERWRLERVKGRRGASEMLAIREYDAEESNEYYHKLLQRPSAFQVKIERTKGELIVKMDPSVAIHQAAAYLVRGRGLEDKYIESLDVEYCLSELSSMGEPLTKDFHVPNSDKYDEAKIDGLVMSLYSRQAKALTRMQSIESGEVEFNEEERSEHTLNGIGWCLIGRASKKSRLRGGVLADAIGSGKTVVTIALILSGIESARKNCDVSRGRSGATLIVVPPGLVRQWDDERKKFTKDTLSCIIINNTATLKKYSVKAIVANKNRLFMIRTYVTSSTL